MKIVSKVISINLFLMLIYSIICFSAFKNDHKAELGYPMYLGMILILHILACWVLSLRSSQTSEKRQAFRISALVVLIVGFSNCMTVPSFY